jgi:hypothetical protein
MGFNDTVVVGSPAYLPSTSRRIHWQGLGN